MQIGERERESNSREPIWILQIGDMRINRKQIKNDDWITTKSVIRVILLLQMKSRSQRKQLGKEKYLRRIRRGGSIIFFWNQFAKLILPITISVQLEAVSIRFSIWSNWDEIIFWNKIPGFLGKKPQHHKFRKILLLRHFTTHKFVYSDNQRTRSQ